MPQVIDLKNRPDAKLESANNGSTSSPQASFSLSHRVLSWSGPIHHPSPNVKSIIILSLIFFAIAALVQFFEKNIISTIFFAMIGLVLLLNIRNKTSECTVELNPAGIKIDDRTYHHNELKSFWIEYDPALGIKELSIQQKKWYAPYIKIHLPEEDPVQIRLFLLQFLPEVEHKDTLVEVLSRKLGI